MTASVLARAALGGIAGGLLASALVTGCTPQPSLNCPAGWDCSAPQGTLPSVFSYSPPPARPCPPATLSPAPLRGKPDCKEAGQ